MSDYYSSWKCYAYHEENRFLSCKHEDLIKICNCFDIHHLSQQKQFIGIPAHYNKETNLVYCLKEGPHSLIEGESGSKKSRTIVRWLIILSALSRHTSFIVNDPKGELSSDPKIKYILDQYHVRTHIVDFRKFDKDGFNPLSYIFEHVLKGEMAQAASSIDKFVNMLLETTARQNKDPYWDNVAGDLIRYTMQLLAYALSFNREGEKYFNLSSVKTFIRQDRDNLQDIFRRISPTTNNNAVHGYNEIIQLSANNTYGCIVSSANALLSDFFSSEALLQMLSVQTFDIRSLYKEPTAIFLIVPDEHKAYNLLSGYLIDQFYQILVETYNEFDKEPQCDIKFIVDEAANIQINDLSSKVSASRSRHIDWNLIFQSQLQMAEAYSRDWATIQGNCKHKIYLGSSDYNILSNISEQAGLSEIRREGVTVPLIRIEDLRKMRKEKTYKDALLITGNHLYCAKLPDYEVLDFLKPLSKKWPKRIIENKTYVYTPDDLFDEYKRSKVIL